MYILKRLFIMIAVITVLIPTGCSKPVVPVRNTEKESIHNSNTDIQQNDDLQAWAGLYKFTEYAPPDENIFYRVSIYKENGEYYGNIYIDGFQTLTRIRTKVLGNSESITLAFLEYLPENTFEPFVEGDILLSFLKQDSKLYTSWGKIQPLISEKAESGKICFELETE